MRVALVLALASAALAVQNPPAVFRSGTELVRFDVRVTGPDGRPITDLRPDEIQVLENGAPLPVLLFQHFDEPAETYAEAALRAVSAEVSSNRGSPRGHLYLIVFDQSHIAAGNEQIARRAAERFINEHVRPSDRVAVIGLPGPGPDAGFTADRPRAIAELSKVRGGLERGLATAVGQLTVHEAYEIAAGNDRIITDVINRQALQAGSDVGGSRDPAAAATVTRQKDRDSEDPAAVRHAVVENARTMVAQADADARDFMLRLGDVLERYRSVEGRKTVILFSEGFHTANLAREIEQVEAAAADAYAVFCAFDLNRRAGTDVGAAAPSTPLASSEIQDRLEPLGSLAAATDGVLVPDAAGHIDAALDRLAAQARDYYLVGFAPAAAALASPGAYRHVDVRVTRPGAHVSARSGYAVPKPGAPLARRTAIDAALAAPFAQQGLRVEYATYEMRGDDAGRSRVILSLEAGLPLREGPNAAADVVFVVRDMRDGRVVASGTDTMPLPADAAGGGSTGVGRYRVHFDVPPGTYMMRAVVREPGGLIGSADRKLSVRGFSGPDVSASDLIFDAPGAPVPVRARAYTKDGLSGLVEVYARSRDQLRDLAVTATLVNAETGTPAATLRADTAEVADTGTALLRRATIAAPLANIAPGAYVAKVRVTAGGETVADLTREVDVIAGSAPPPPASGAPALNPRDVVDSDYVKPARAALRAANTPAAAQAVKGFDLFERGDYVAAAAELAPAFAADQHDAALAFVLGWAYEASGDRRQAIGSWRAAAAIDPRFLPAHLALADAYLQMSETALAAQAVKAGLAALPDSPELQTRLAQIQKR